MSTTQAVDGEFTDAVAPYRRELFAHCYRMMGSFHDAEDLAQETLLRAWKGYGSFQGSSSLRTWLHRIATNTCLTALESRQRRPLPTGLGAPSSAPDAELVDREDILWLEPVPDSALGDAGDPGAIVEMRESVRLAFIAALQHLPPRQRAVLVLRDVLQWRTAEVAEAIGATTATVNSLLQRARERMAMVSPSAQDVADPESPETRALLNRYVEGFQSYDIDALVEMFTDDAVWEMPPYEGWYQGAADIGALIRTQCPAQAPGDMVMVRTAANGQPAYGLYMRSDDGTHRAFQLQVVDVGAGGVRHVASFFDVALFERFGLPPVLGEDPAATTP